MKAEYINPFVTSLVTTFGMMLSCEAKRGTIHLKDDTKPVHPISGVIGLSGKTVGTVVLNVSEALALKATSTLLMVESTEVDDDVVDAIGELTNMIAGGAKAQLEQFELSISLPNVVTGVDHDIRFPSNVARVCIPFETDWGPMTLEIGLAEVAQPAQPQPA